ncbi:hypothetical protein KALB_65 [Kutzneria albida DSM 43870]|uniref:N-acetyltransferase domain-containing protein n=1 Tax=Kutzneria albida DSM 43870 TaxID=1449976 RepID=W5VXZ6_9PSEU|nr:hypothetical protein KALB_65 [Kutzneria albida DSM 43870]
MCAGAAGSSLRAVDTQITEYLLAGRDTRIGPFLARFDAHSDNPYVNYAMPEIGAEPTSAEVDVLVAEFRSRNRKPRLEYVPSSAPAVQPRLESAGFEVERLHPLMTCTPESVPEIELDPEFEALTVTSDEDLLALHTALCEAYGSPAPEATDVARTRAMLNRGGMAMLVRTRSGEPAGGGMYTAPTAGATEIAGIGVRPAWQRRGIAAAVTSYLTRTAYNAGLDTPFLTAAGEREAAIYNRAGFTTTGRILHISLPG